VSANRSDLKALLRAQAARLDAQRPAAVGARPQRKQRRERSARHHGISPI
jgi:hypothetical protein